jgi:hypothetical protein
MRQYLDAHGHAFSSEEVEILSSALDRAWKIMQSSGSQFYGDGHILVVRNALAKQIIAEFQRGEINPRRLCESVLARAL